MAKRTDKLGRQLQKDLGEILDSAAQQLLNGTLVTVLDVEVTPDLGLAKVYLSFFQSTDKQADLETLRNHLPQIRHYLAGKLKNQVRKIPELMLFIDDTNDQAEHMENLLRQLREKKD